jgi:signal transduction histidine kinase
VAAPHRQGATRLEESYGDVPAVWASAGQLSQVFVNLLVNALQSAGQVGTVKVETLLEGDCALVRVSDDGGGIAPEHRDRLFDPFFTTKPAGEGTGLGLYVSHEIVRGHGGEIVVNSTPGEGATFEVRLPVAQS